jgi:hypothetical protein
MPWTAREWDAFDLWIAAWIAERPELHKLSKKARWHLAKTAWNEMRRREKAAERLHLNSLDDRYSVRGDRTKQDR